jgi:hypothetical protein
MTIGLFPPVSAFDFRISRYGSRLLDIRVRYVTRLDDAFRREIALYADDLKTVGVFSNIDRYRQQQVTLL